MILEYPCIFNDVDTVMQYDKLRLIDPKVMQSVCSLVVNIVHRLPPVALHRILDAGSGTGRFAIPIAERLAIEGSEAEIVALDICQPMLTVLRERWAVRNSTVHLVCLQADLQEPLPPAANAAHIIFTVATFHILEKWRNALENLVNALSPNGFLIFVRENNQFMHQTEGFEKDTDFPYLHLLLKNFMQFYHSRRTAVGEPYIARLLRYSDMTPAVHYLRALGLVEQDLDIHDRSFEWQKPHTFADILHCFRYKQMTTWGSDLSENARQTIADELDQWVTQRGVDPSAEFFLPAKLIPHVFQKQSK